MVKRITILGKRWRLLWQRVETDDGRCDPNPPRTIYVAPDMDDENTLATLVHEMLHGAGWHLDEDFVDRFSMDVAREATRLGYRRG